MTENQRAPLWERQPWDTDKSYAAFLLYLRMDAKERSIDGAYRLFQQQSNSKPAAKKGKPARSSGNFSCWAAGLNSEGKRPAGSVYAHSVPWAVRVRAWEDDQQRQWEAEWATRKRETRDAEWEVSQRLLQRGREMLASPVFRTKDVQGPNGKTILLEPADWTEGDMLRCIELSSKLARRATGMETERHAVQDDDWRKQLSDAGINPDTLLEDFSDFLVWKSQQQGQSSLPEG